MGERAGLVDDLVQCLGVVVVDRHQSKSGEGQCALVGGAVRAFAIGIRCRHQDVLEVLLDGGRVGLRPARPGTAQDVRAAHELESVIAQVEHRLATRELDWVVAHPSSNLLRILRVSLVPGEIPHPREIPDRDHVGAPGPEILVGSAAHLRERATTPCVAEPGRGTVRQLIEGGLPRFLALIDVRLERLEIREGERRTRVCECTSLP